MSLPGRLLQILTLRCEAASELSSRELDETLGLAERLALLGHRASCAACRRFRRQIRLIRDAVKAPAIDDGLSLEARARIAHALAESGGDGNPPIDHEP